MSKRVLLFVLASVLMQFCISAQDYTVKGSVWDFDIAEPICSVAVSVYQITGNDTIFCGGDTTDDNGSFTIGNLKAGDYVLRTIFDYYFNAPKNFTLSPGTYIKDLGKKTMRYGKGDPDPAIKAVVAKIVDYFPENVYVDLGLSVKWATCNVGADKPEDVGGLYAWGETDTKTEYSYATYKFSVDGVRGNYTKYSDKDSKTVLDQEDDVAHVKWGGSWRVPTSAEMDELRRECNWTWTTENGVKGFRVSGKKEGYENNSIFLPVNAFNDSVAVATLHQYPEYGVYWSSTLSNESGSFLMGGWDHANGIWFCRDASMGNGSYRNEGRSIRPVHP